MKNFFSIGFLFVVLVITGNALFVVKETERAVMLQFGQLVNSDIAPGLHVKIPWVNTVRKFDARIQTEDTTPERFFNARAESIGSRFLR
jgi:membrane protease subunit HflC